MSDLPIHFSIYIVGVTLAIIGSVARTLILNGQNYTIIGFTKRFIMAVFASSCLFFIGIDIFEESPRYVIFGMGITGFFSDDVVELLKRLFFKRIGIDDDAKKG
jgi:hypothetical protein